MKVKVVICTGTACFVMGGSELLMLEEQLPAHLAGQVDISGCSCMEFCKDETSGKAPFVQIDDRVMSQATVEKVIDAIEKRIEAKREVK